MIIVPDVEAIMVAFENLIKTSSFFETVTRIWQPWDQVNELIQPAAVIVEPTEANTARRGQQPGLKLEVLVLCYLRMDPKSCDNPPNTYLNSGLKAVRTALLPTGSDITKNAQTLGGLVSNVFIDGKIAKDAGIIDNQGSILIPVTIEIT